jgi:uncharacterized membrane protein
MEQGFVSSDLKDIAGVVKYFEQKTICELVVRISAEKAMPEPAAREEFVRLGLDRDQRSLGLLIYINTFQRTFVILSGSGIVEKLGEDWAAEHSRTLSDRFRKYQFGYGLHEIISRMAQQLSVHFPSANQPSEPA